MITVFSTFHNFVSYQKSEDSMLFQKHIKFCEMNIRCFEKLNTDHWNGTEVLDKETIEAVMLQLAMLYKKKIEYTNKVNLGLPFTAYPKILA